MKAGRPALQKQPHPLLQQLPTQNPRHVQHLEIEPAIPPTPPPLLRHPPQVLGGDHGHVRAATVGRELPDSIHRGVVGVRHDDQEAGDRITRVADVPLELPQVRRRKRVGGLRALVVPHQHVSARLPAPAEPDAAVGVLAAAHLHQLKAQP